MVRMDNGAVILFVFIYLQKDGVVVGIERNVIIIGRFRTFATAFHKTVLKTGLEMGRNVMRRQGSDHIIFPFIGFI